MQITGMLVTRGNHPASSIEAAPGEVLELTYGDTLRVTATIEYRGEAFSDTFRALIGSLITEMGSTEASVAVSFPRCLDWTPFQLTVDIPIAGTIMPGTGFSLRVELVGKAQYAAVLGCITITGIPPQYQLVQDTTYPWDYTHEGDAERCRFFFSLEPMQFPLAAWFGQRIINAFVGELEKQGHRLLTLKVWEDRTPVFQRDYIVEVTSTASPSIPWTLIIIGVMAILFIISVTYLILTVDKVFLHRKPLTEETKMTFSRETLIAMILDLEPDIPRETLNQASDQELRDLLNKILAAKQPLVTWPTVPGLGTWGTVALVAGVAAVGIGAAVVVSRRRKKR